jgi:hypothetical protein
LWLWLPMVSHQSGKVCFCHSNIGNFRPTQSWRQVQPPWLHMPQQSTVALPLRISSGCNVILAW